MQEKLQEDSGPQYFDDTPFILFYWIVSNYVVNSNYLYWDAVVKNS